MSLLPYIIKELVSDRFNPVERLYDQHFGLGVPNDDLVRRPSIAPRFAVPALSGYLRPFAYVSPDESGVSTIHDDKTQFKINLDVQQFKPEEIKVTVTDDTVMVEGKHEERQDKHGFISRQFIRRYKLPANTNLDAIKSNLSSDGVLSVVAPKMVVEDKTKNREIPITHVHKPALKQTAKAVEKPEKMET